MNGPFNNNDGDNYAFIYYLCGEILKYTICFFINNTFISNTRLKLAKTQTNAKQDPEAELLLFQNYPHTPSILSSKTNMRCSKK